MFFTILAVFSAAGDMLLEPMIFPSLQACSDHMEKLVYLDEMKKVDMFCIESESLSISLKPQYRPFEISGL